VLCEIIVTLTGDTDCDSLIVTGTLPPSISSAAQTSVTDGSQSTDNVSLATETSTMDGTGVMSSTQLLTSSVVSLQLSVCIVRLQ